MRINNTGESAECAFQTHLNAFQAAGQAGELKRSEWRDASADLVLNINSTKTISDDGATQTLTSDPRKNRDKRTESGNGPER